jgi:amicyanin
MKKTLGIALAVAFALPAHAGGDKVAFPANYDKGVLYATVDRHDVKQFRELWATPASAVEAVKAGKGVPSGTVLTLVQYKAKVDDKGAPMKDANGRFQKGDLIAYTVMEKRAGWGTEYGPELRNGEWEYQAFGPSKAVNDKANLKSCFQCHKPHAGTAPGAKVVAKTGADRVAISEFLFGPEKLEVKAGQYVTWTNTDDSPHQVTIAGEGGVRTAVILKGQSETLKFTAPGTYDYICGLHPGMKGKVEVK